MTFWILLGVGWFTLLWIASLLGEIKGVLTDIRNDQFHQYKDIASVLREMEAISEMTLLEVEKMTSPPAAKYNP